MIFLIIILIKVKLQMGKYIQNLLILIMIISCIHCEQWYETGNPHFLDTQTVFPAIKQQNSIKVLKFFSPWCKYCRYIKAYVDQYKQKNQINSNLKFYQFNCQSNGPMFCFQHFQVRAYPAVLIINEKGETVSRIDGLYPQDVVNNLLTQYNNKAKAILESLNQSKQQNQQKEQNNKQQQTKQVQAVSKIQNKQQNLTNKQTEKKQEIVSQDHKQSQKIQQKKQQAHEQLPKEQKKIDQAIQLNEKQKQKKEQKIQEQVMVVVPEQAKGLGQQQSGDQEQQEQQKQQEIKVSRQMVQQSNVEQISRPHPTNPELQKELFKGEDSSGQQSSSFIKYFLYLMGISIGVLYGIKIITSRRDERIKQMNKEMKDQDRNAGKPKGANQRMLTAKDIENQILVEEVADQHL